MAQDDPSRVKFRRGKTNDRRNDMHIIEINAETRLETCVQELRREKRGARGRRLSQVRSDNSEPTAHAATAKQSHKLSFG